MSSVTQPPDDGRRTRVLFAVFLGAVAVLVALTHGGLRNPKPQPRDQDRIQKDLRAPAATRQTGPLDKVRIYNARKEYSKAEDLSRSILSSDPGNREAKRLLASALFHQNRIEESARIIESIPLDGPAPSAEPLPRPIENQPDPLLNRAQLHRQRHEYRQAEDIYRSILRNDPDNAPVRRLLAAALSEESADVLNGIANPGAR